MSDELTAGDDAVRGLLAAPRTWAVVGCSPDPARDSHRIARLLLERGNRVVPVNPAADRILGQRSYPALFDVPEPVDVVDLFRRSEAVGGHVDEAIEVGARAVWMQLGVIDAQAARAARDAGLIVVMDRCPAIEVRRLGIA
jgi:uncharacterized protein